MIDFYIDLLIMNHYLDLLMIDFYLGLLMIDLYSDLSIMNLFIFFNDWFLFRFVNNESFFKSFLGFTVLRNLDFDIRSCQSGPWWAEHYSLLDYPFHSVQGIFNGKWSLDQISLDRISWSKVSNNLGVWPN